MNLFTDHPNDSGLTYFGHLKFAIWAGIKMMLTGSTSIFHAFLPFLFKWRAIDTCQQILDEANKWDVLNNVESKRF